MFQIPTNTRADGFWKHSKYFDTSLQSQQFQTAGKFIQLKNIIYIQWQKIHFLKDQKAKTGQLNESRLDG